MHIARLVLKGFKSFYRHTSLEFSPGFNVIVGPNGSGKSNIIDALEFVFGSIAFSEMRAKKSLELIYNSGKKSSDFALVEVVLKNSEEVRISRKLLKDGTSVYRINGKRARRADIIEFLASINVFGQNIVHQGEIERIALMSPSERKKLIDELAEIEMYERKKSEALQNLEEVRARLGKVLAVYGEKEKQLRKLEEEKKRVERFYELKKLEEKARNSLIGKKINELKERIEEIGKEIDRLEGEKVELEKKVKELGEELAKLNLQKPSEDAVKNALERVKFLERRRNEVKEDLDRILRRKKALESELRGNERNLEKIREELASIEEKLVAMKNRERELQKEIEEESRRIKAMEEEFRKKYEEYRRLRDEYEEKKLRLRELEVELGKINREIESLIKEKEKLEERKKGVEEEKRKFFEEKARAEQRLREIDEELKKLGVRREELERIIENARYIPPRGVLIGLSEGAKLFGLEIPENELRSYLPFIHVLLAENADEIAEKIEKKGAWAVLFKGSAEEAMKKLRINLPFVTAGTPKKAEVLPNKDELIELGRELEELKRREKELERERAKLGAVISKKFEYPAWIDTRLSEVKARISEMRKKRKEVEEELKKIRTELKPLPPEPKRPSKDRLEKLWLMLDRLRRDMASLEARKAGLSEKSKVLEEEKQRIARLIAEIEKDVPKLKEKLKEAERELEKASEEYEKAREEFEEAMRRYEKVLTEIKEKERKKKALEERLVEIRVTRELLKKELSESYKKLEELRANFDPGMETVENPEKVLKKVISELNSMKELNFAAPREYEVLRKEVEEVLGRVNKLREEERSILDMIERIDEEKSRAFNEALSKINEAFGRYFRQLLGGRAQLVLEESGIDVDIELEGRKASLYNLSGGQKTLVAIAFLLALKHYKPAPFYVFDEIDASLDKENSEKLANLLKELSKEAQIIAITHNDVLVGFADQIIGVFKQKGYSRAIGLPKERVVKESLEELIAGNVK